MKTTEFKKEPYFLDSVLAFASGKVGGIPLACKTQIMPVDCQVNVL
ncbi:MAG: hypothetical protein WC657_06385 [Candidatus Paceibacterota bacterium]|jgi:hypothetical protein